LLDHFVLGLAESGARSDEGHPDSRERPNSGGLPWYELRITPGLGGVGRTWDALYNVIWRANQVIEGLNGMDEEFKTEEEWVNQMGQARLLRGLIHFYLHSAYNNGEIIIRDNVPADPSDFSKPVSTSDEVITFFRKDLEYAYQNLPPAFEEKSRVDGGLAATILGTSYLYSEDYEKAMVFFRDVLNNPEYGYELLQDPSLLFTSAGDFNAESIFEINYTLEQQLEETQWHEESFNNRLARLTGAPNPVGGASDLVPAAWLTYAYSNEALDTQDLRNYVEDENGGTRLRNVSLRSSQFIAVVNDDDTEFYQSPAANQILAFNRTLFSFFKKYTNHDIVASENETGATSWKSGKNVVVNRLSDVYLMYAECLLKTGDRDGAIQYINEVRKRWGLVLLGVSDGSAHDFDDIAYTDESLMEHLMNVERPLELSFEGFNVRNNDLRRWGIGKQRYQDLSQQVWHLIDYDYVNAEGDNAIRRDSFLQAGPSPNVNDFPEIVEFTGAAQNYIEGTSEYLPLPTSEVLNNEQTSN